MTDLTSLSPAEIDAVIYAGQQKIGQALARVEQYKKLADSANTYVGNAYRAQKYLDAAEQQQAIADEAQAEIAPYNAEYVRRGRWNRAYLVLASNGHVHSSTHCTTCFPTTQYHWVTALSGMDEAEIVDAAGERACTVCYPTAPVEKLAQPTRVFSPSEVEAQQARAEREAKRTAAATAQVNDPVTGKMLFKTERGATNAIASNLDSMVHYGPTHPSFSEWQAEVENTIKALHAKGVEFDYEAALAKARKKKVAEHKRFMKSAQAAQMRRDGFLSPEVDEPNYNPVKF